MTNEIEQTTMNEPNLQIFGDKLKASREKQGLERKDVAAQLRLNERFIIMMEEGSYAKDLPPTFLRGYLRSYSKLLQIADLDVAQALEAIPTQAPVQTNIPATLPTKAVTSSHYFMQVFTYLIVFTLVGLVGSWWYNHSASSSSDGQTTNLAVASNEQAIPLPITNLESNAPSNPTVGPQLADASAPNAIGANAAPNSNSNASATPANTDKPSLNNKNVGNHHNNDDDDDSDENEANDDN